MTEAIKKRRGRPCLPAAEAKSTNLKFRARAGLRERLAVAAAGNDRSLSEEIERRLEESFVQAGMIEAVRAEIRDCLDR